MLPGLAWNAAIRWRDPPPAMRRPIPSVRVSRIMLSFAVEYYDQHGAASSLTGARWANSRSSARSCWPGRLRWTSPMCGSSSKRTDGRLDRINGSHHHFTKPRENVITLSPHNGTVGRAAIVRVARAIAESGV